MEIGDRLRRLLGEIDATFPRRAQDDPQQQWRCGVANQMPGARQSFRVRLKAKLNRRRRDAERVAKGLVLQQLEPHVGLRRHLAAGKPMVELLGIGRGKTESLRRAGYVGGETALQMALQVE